jgi:WD40 repeat protein
MVWETNSKGYVFRIEENPLHILYGHDHEVTCVDINIELDVAVSGSKDGSVAIHTLRRGQYVRSIFHPKRLEILMVKVSSQGQIVVYSKVPILQASIHTLAARLDAVAVHHKRENDNLP